MRRKTSYEGLRRRGWESNSSRHNDDTPYLQLDVDITLIDIMNTYDKSIEVCRFAQRESGPGGYDGKDMKEQKNEGHQPY